MYTDKGNGYEEVMGVKCYLPPMPKKSDIRNFGLSEKNQLWKRTEYPQLFGRDVDWVTKYKKANDPVSWSEARSQEIAMQTGFDIDELDRSGNPKKVGGIIPDPNYLNPKLDEFRRQEFERCCPYNTDPDDNPLENGLWFYNNGKPTYITPFHYFYLNWWRLDTGYPYYRDTDRRKFYYWQAAFECNSCYGITEAAKRGEGKTARATAVQYLTTIYTKDCVSAIQSKTEKDAYDKIFVAKLVSAYRHLPDFFKPINKHGTVPTNKFEFSAVGKRGKMNMAHQEDQLEALNSRILYYNAGVKAADGDNIYGVFLRDEEGKTEECDVWERHSVTKYCVYRDGSIIGKIYSTTTVDEQSKGGGNYQKIWKSSNPLNTNEVTGETKSGLWKLFVPAYESEVFDIYGNPVIDDPKPDEKVYNQKDPKKLVTQGAKTKQMATRKELEDDPEAFLKYCLQNPHKEEELFYSNADGCPFNVMILERNEMRFKSAGMKDLGVVTGNFTWADGKPFTKAVFTEDLEENSRWHVHEHFLSKEFMEKKANRVKSWKYKDKTYYSPLNIAEFSAGFDPTKTAKVENKRRSKAGGSIFRKPQFFETDGPMNTWVADYVWLPDDPLKQYEDFLMGIWYFGSQVLLENNISSMLNVYQQYGCYDPYSPDEHFILWRWEETFTSKKKSNSQFEPGMPSNDVTNDMLLKNAVSHVLNHGSKIVLPRTNEAFKVYRESERGKNDLGVAAQLSCMAAQKPEEAEQEAEERVSDWFRMM